MNERFFVFCLMACVIVFAALVTGFTCGFGGFLLYVAGLSLATWLWRRYVVCRRRVARRGAFVGNYMGGPCYLLEVA